jgi:hypothetical protein
MADTETAEAGETARLRLFHCSFCGKWQTDVKKLIAGPGVFICDECVGLCDKIIAESPEPASDPAKIMTPENMPTEKLIALLPGYNKASERADAGMQDIVDVLREREVSWAAIGEALGVSRQAAWKRFA